MLSQLKLKERLYYSPVTGEFTSVVGSNRKVGTLKSNGYLQIKIQGKCYTAHRLAWLYVFGVWPEGQIDHINRIRNDNRICNLRDVDHKLNMGNNSKNTSGYPGVRYEGNKWRAQIGVEGRTIILGRFDTKEEAIQIRKEAETKYNFYGESK